MNYNFTYGEFYYTFYSMSNAIDIWYGKQLVLNKERIADLNKVMTKRMIRDWAETWIEEYKQSAVENDYITEYE